MKSLFAPMIPWWETRNRRERVLLLALAALVAALTAWYGAALPLQRAAAGAHDHYARAAQQLVEVEISVADIAARAASTHSGMTLAEAAARSAAASGLTLDRQSAETAQEVTVWASAAAPAAMFDWVRMLGEEHGVFIAGLTATRDAEGVLRVEALLIGSRP